MWVGVMRKRPWRPETGNGGGQLPSKCRITGLLLAATQPSLSSLAVPNPRHVLVAIHIQPTGGGTFVPLHLCGDHYVIVRKCILKTVSTRHYRKKRGQPSLVPSLFGSFILSLSELCFTI